MGEMKTFAAKPHNNGRGRERKVREVDLSKVRSTAAIVGILVFIAIVSLIASLLFLRPKTYTATFFDDVNGDGVYAESELVAEYTVKGWRFAFPKSVISTPLFFFGKYTVTIGEETLTGDYIDIIGRRANLSLELPIALEKDDLLFTGWYQLDAKGNTVGNVATTKEFFSTSSKLDDYTFAAKYIKDYLTITREGVVTGIVDGVNLTNLVIPEKYNGIKIVAIGDSAFQNQKNLVSVTLPESVTEIATFAFAGCSSLYSINLPAKVTSIGSSAFKGCALLSSIVIPNSVTTIGDSAFENCSSLSKVNIPAAVTMIATSTFKGCKALAGIEIPESVTTISNSAFEGCSSLESVNIPSAIKSIASSTFKGCSALSSIVIPDSVIKINDSAFAGCEGLETVTVGNGVTSAVPGSFSGCENIRVLTAPMCVVDEISKANLQTVTINAGKAISENAFCVLKDGVNTVTNLKSVTICEGITVIGANAFNGCLALTTVEIPASVASIAIDAFAYCNNLENIKVAYENKNYESIHNGCIVANGADGKDVLIVGCKNSTLCDEFYRIEKYAFAGNTNIKEITIPECVTEIADGAFEGCSNLTSVKILGAVASIGKNTFAGCSSLNSFIIPESVTAIGAYAFSGTALTEIAIPAKVAAIAEGAFKDCDALAIVAVAEGNEGYKVVNNCLVTVAGDGEKYKVVLATDKVTIIADMVEIAPYAFNKVLKEITIESINWEVKEDIFANCTEATTVVFGKDVNADKVAPLFKTCAKINNVTANLSVVDIFLNRGLAKLNVTLLAAGKIADGEFANCPAIYSLTISEGVTELGKNVFAGSAIETITLPKTLTVIGDSAFANCKKLTEITLPDGVTATGKNAFENSSLAKINLPASLTTIDEYAFENCKNLNSITLPDGVTAINKGAFAGSGIVKITLPESITGITTEVFKGSALKEITLPTTLETIGDYVFENCSGLTSLKIVSNLKNVSEAAFSGSSIKSVEIGKDVTEIYLFCDEKIESLTVEAGNAIYTGKANCILKGTTIVLACKTSDIVASGATAIAEKAFIGSVYTKITIPENITEIATGAFYNCTNLTEIVIIDTDKSLAGYTSAIFEKCEKIEKVTLPAYDIACVPKNALKTVIFSGGDVIPQEALKECTTLTSVIIPDGVTAIEPSAFEGCIKLASVTVPNGVTSIGAAAFDGCKSLETIEIPYEVTTIGEKAFFDSGLTAIYIYDSVTSVGEYAFGNCTGLETVRISPYVKDGLDPNAFAGCNAITTVEAPTYALANINLAKVVTLTINDYEYGATLDASLLNNAKSLKTLNIGRGVTTISNIEYLDMAGVTFTVDENNESFEVVGGKIEKRTEEK